MHILNTGEYMKKICFGIFLLLALLLFCLFSCTKSGRLYDVVLRAVTADESLPAGQISCYGRSYKNGMSEDFLSDYLGLAGYPDFADKIEEMAIYSSLKSPLCELTVLRLYRSSDAGDARLFLERRIKETLRALKLSGMEGYAETAYIEVYGNVVVLYMLPNNEAIEKAVKSAI